MKFFLITIDTEGDNLWRYTPDSEITTHNVDYLPRFQLLCDKYGYKPVYLSNYEILKSKDFIEFAKSNLIKKKCEIGLHLHAWNNPPLIDLQGDFDGNPYLIEYSIDIMREKFKSLYNLYIDSFQIEPVSHRAGRWAMNDVYFELLKEFGIKVDCSITPGIDWNSCKGKTRGGANYTNSITTLHYINGIMEVPPSIRNCRYLSSRISFRENLRSIIFGRSEWIRPNGNNLNDMKRLIQIIEKERKSDYIEFMIHSSELMPGGSPNFVTKESIDRLYEQMDDLFKYLYDLKYTGCTLAEYYIFHKKDV